MRREPAQGVVELEEAAPEQPSTNPALDEVLASVAPPKLTPAPAAPTAAGQVYGLRSAQVVSINQRRVTVAWRGRTDTFEALLAPEVEEAIVTQAIANGDGVLVEAMPGEPPLVVGVIQTRIPKEVRIKADVIELDAEREITFRSGRAGVRLRSDGDVEIVGSRIHAASRGLFKLVGRILRLN